VHGKRRGDIGRLAEWSSQGRFPVAVAYPVRAGGGGDDILGRQSGTQCRQKDTAFEDFQGPTSATAGTVGKSLIIAARDPSRSEVSTAITKGPSRRAEELLLESVRDVIILLTPGLMASRGPDNPYLGCPLSLLEPAQGIVRFAQ
jgi:hypothetical protein